MALSEVSQRQHSGKNNSTIIFDNNILVHELTILMMKLTNSVSGTHPSSCMDDVLMMVMAIVSMMVMVMKLTDSVSRTHPSSCMDDLMMVMAITSMMVMVTKLTD